MTFYFWCKFFNSTTKAKEYTLQGFCHCISHTQAHFAIADNYPKDTNCTQLGKLMLVQQQNPSGEHGAPTFVGQYYDACKLFADENEDKMKQNNVCLDSLLRSQQSSYWTGENLWSKALSIKRSLLNEIHTVFCQEVNRQWPMLPFGTTVRRSHALAEKEALCKESKRVERCQY